MLQKSPDFRDLHITEASLTDSRYSLPSVREVQKFFGEDDHHLKLSSIIDCSKQKDLTRGSQIHADIVKRGLFGQDVYVDTALVSMYAKCGELVTAQEVFDELPVRNAVSWNALISGYAHHGLGHEALHHFWYMHEEGIFPSAVTFICALKACGSIGAFDMGEEIHAEVSKLGLLAKDMVLASAVVAMYAKCGLLAKAQQVFDKLPMKNVALWNVLITGYAKHGLGQEALKYFRQMQGAGISPDVVTLICILNACANSGAADIGQQIHAEIAKQGLLGNNMVLSNGLVDLYAKCGLLAKAQKVFDELPLRNAISWTVLIAGYVQHGLGYEALKCFEWMRKDGFMPDVVTYICILKACGSIGAAKVGEEIHAEVSKCGWLRKDIVLHNALMDMYAKCGSLAIAQKLFDELPVRSVVSWNALITGYANHGLGHEAWKHFQRMQDERISVNTVTFLSVLKACGDIGAAEIGELIHEEVSKRGLLETDMSLGNALLDMYAKCGWITDAQELFDKLSARDVVSWTVLIAGYAQLGRIKTVFDSFDRMIGESIVPDAVTFTVLLTACSHAGLVEKGRMYYNIMNTIYSITPTLVHSACMVNLLSHAGYFDEAIRVISTVPSSDCFLLWMALLGACRKWLNLELGKQAFGYLLQLNEKHAAAYTCMSSIYAAAGMQEEADKIEELRIRNQAWKVPGRCWWTDVHKNVHSFSVGDGSHPQNDLIYAKIKEIRQKLVLDSYPMHYWIS